MPQIIVNGKSYASMDEMPAEIRQTYEQAMGVLADNNKNGIPDVLEGGISKINLTGTMAPMVINSTNIVVDGKLYSNANELPPEARQKYEQAMAKLAQRMGDANQNGVPDLLEGVIPTQAGSTSFPTSPNTASTPMVTSLIAEPLGMGDVTLRYKGLLLIAGILIVSLVVTLIVVGLFIVPPLLKLESLYR
jgi:hypothetical protein